MILNQPEAGLRFYRLTQLAGIAREKNGIARRETQLGPRPAPWSYPLGSRWGSLMGPALGTRWDPGGTLVDVLAGIVIFIGKI